MNSSLIGGFGKEGPLGSQLAPEKAPLLVQSSGPGETHTDRDRFRLHPKGGARHDVLFAPLEENWDPDVVFEPAGVLPDSEQRPHRGYDGVLSFIANQMEAFTEMWMEPPGVQ